MLFYATLLNYCYCGAVWGISFESFSSDLREGRVGKTERCVNYNARFTVTQLGYHKSLGIAISELIHYKAVACQSE